MRILSVVLFLWAAVSSAQLPRIDVSADFDSAGNPSAKFAINTKQFNMPTIRLYPHKAGSAWSPAGLVWYMSYGRNNSVTNLITIGPGSVSSTYVDFSPSATTFAQTVNNGYAVFSCQTTNGQPVSFADGSITIERAPEMFVGNNILLGSTTGTGPVNWSLFSHYLGTWPFYAGTNTTIGYTSTGIVISSSINTNYFNSSVVGGSNVIVVVVTNGQEKTYTVHSSVGGTIDYIQFNTNYTDGLNTARMQWNADDGTVELGLPGGTVNLQLGQEQLIYVRNVSGVTISNGQVVARTGQIGNSRPNVSLADADSTNAYLRIPIGVATETIADNQSGYVTSAGLVRDVNTAGFMGGVPLYLSTTPGQLTTTIPGYPLDAVMIGESIMSNAVNGILHVQISPMKTYALLDAQYESRTNVAVLGLAVTNNNSVRIAADAALTSSVLSLTASLGNVSGRVVTVEGYTNAAAQGAAAFAWGNHATSLYASAANLANVSGRVVTLEGQMSGVSNIASAAYPASNPSNFISSDEVAAGYLSITGGLVNGSIDINTAPEGMGASRPIRFISYIAGINQWRTGLLFLTQYDGLKFGYEGSYNIIAHDGNIGSMTVNLGLGTNAPAAWTNQPSLIALSNSVSSLSTGKQDMAQAIVWSNAHHARLVVLETGALTRVLAASSYATTGQLVSVSNAFSARITANETGKYALVDALATNAHFVAAIASAGGAGWSGYAATQTVPMARQAISNVARIIFSTNGITGAIPGEMAMSGTSSVMVTFSAGSPRTILHSGNYGQYVLTPKLTSVVEQGGSLALSWATAIPGNVITGQVPVAAMSSVLPMTTWTPWSAAIDTRISALEQLNNSSLFTVPFSLVGNNRTTVTVRGGAVVLWGEDTNGASRYVVSTLAQQSSIVTGTYSAVSVETSFQFSDPYQWITGIVSTVTNTYGASEAEAVVAALARGTTGVLVRVLGVASIGAGTNKATTVQRWSGGDIYYDRF